MYLSRPGYVQSLEGKKEAENERDCGSKALDIQTKTVSRRDRPSQREWKMEDSKGGIFVPLVRSFSFSFVPLSPNVRFLFCPVQSTCARVE